MSSARPVLRRARSLVLVVALGAAGAVAFAAVPRGHGARMHGTISYGSFHSNALDGTDHYSIYLPSGYRHSRRRYPVIYFLHGLPEQPDAYGSIGTVAQAVERSGHQAIVVGAQGDRTGDSDPEWLDWGPGRNWETATAVELVRKIDSRYRTIRSRAGRVIIGISAGGYGATLIANHHPGTYSVIESWSGYFHATNPAGTAPLDLGSEEANDWANFHKQIPQLRSRFGRYFKSTWFGFYVGTNDNRFRAENQQLHRELSAARVPHVLFRLYRGGHNWGLWQQHAVAWIRTALSVVAQPR